MRDKRASVEIRTARRIRRFILLKFCTDSGLRFDGRDRLVPIRTAAAEAAIL